MLCSPFQRLSLAFADSAKRSLCSALHGRSKLMNSQTQSSSSRPSTSTAAVGPGCDHNNTPLNGHAADVNMSTYESAVKALHGLMSNAEELTKNRCTGRRIKACFMEKYLNRCGITMESIDELPIIHVSGTKGKGSTCAFLERILHQHGHRTGLFTSPHLVEVRERIRINGRPIDRDSFAKYFWQVYNRLKETEGVLPLEEGGNMPPYFAFLTVLCLRVFLAEGVDVAVLEVGLGGQNDNTNAIRQPVVCGVTSLGLDHTAVLGNTIGDIAWHKAGIFKSHCPAITVQQKPEAMDIILDRAKERQSPVFLSQSLSEGDLERFGLRLGIAGHRQPDNASLALNLYHMFVQEQSRDVRNGRDVSNPNGLSDPKDIPCLSVTQMDQSTIQALRECVWPGRAQTLKKSGVTFYLDGAHTPESMQVCMHWFKQAADAEVKRSSGRVARVLIFNITHQRPAPPLLRLIKDADIDVAIFCTNLLSTVESANIAAPLPHELSLTDQLNRTVTLPGMMQTVDKNKQSWDSLFAPGAEAESPQKSSPPRPDPQTDVFANRMNGSAWPAHAAVDANPSRETSGGSSLSRNGSQPHTVDGQNRAGSLSWSCDQARRTTSHSSHQETHHSKSDQNGNNLSHQSVNGGEANTVVNSKKVSQKNWEETGVCSFSFPCIVDALSWVAQGRDPTLASPDLSSLPALPAVLAEAETVQVLVTGSLLLVGGVLGVLSPHIND